MSGLRLSGTLRVAVAACAFVLMGSGSPANAVPLRFQLSGPTGGSFDLDSNPTAVPIRPGLVRIAYSNPTGEFRAASAFEMFDFGNVNQFVVPRTMIDMTSYVGGQIYSGSFASPSFFAGRWSLSANSFPGQQFTLIVSAIRVAPPPSGPGVPAPEVGGGLLSALAAVLAFGLTRGGAVRTMERRNC